MYRIYTGQEIVSQLTEHIFMLTSTHKNQLEHIRFQSETFYTCIYSQHKNNYENTVR